jgi:8-oxo-dGTP pyrophosphatase MutT (NUDIX family)
VIEPYYVLEYPDWVHIVVINHKKEVLITKQYRHGAGTIVYELPCGAQDKADPNIMAATQREPEEETGFTGDFKLVGKVFANPANQTNKVWVYLVTNPSLTKDPEDNPSEIIKYSFIPIQEVEELIDQRLFSQSLQVSSLYLALRKYN